MMRASMADSRPLLQRLLNSPDISRVVPHLPVDVLHRVIQICGLEHCGEIVALSTPDQLTRLLDLDLWRAPTPGHDEVLDADRFGLWLEVLMESGAAVAAEKLAALDVELVIGGLARHLRVFDGAAVSSYTTTDGVVVAARRAVGDAPTCEIGGYAIESRRTGPWDAILELLAFMNAERPDDFHRLLRGCRRLSDGEREIDGMDDLLPDDEQEGFNLVVEREARREKQGYVAPAQAHAFLRAARQLSLGAEQPARDPIASAFFGSLELTPPANEAARSEPPGSSTPTDPGSVREAAISEVIDILHEAGVLISEPRRLLASGDAPRLPLIQRYLESLAIGTDALGFLGNTLMAGGTLQARPFTAREASDAVLATCNLGLDNWPERWRDRDLVTVFRVGRTILHRDICMYATEQLRDMLADFHCADRDIQFRLTELRLELLKHGRDGSPWRARHALEVMVMLDAPCWAALAGLIDEFPVMHAALGASLARASRSVNADAFEFISTNGQIATVREFMRSLPALLRR
ncbi:MAG TPA: DUF6178 family protein [Vicinamibacterales bacterium]|nr:DUF6178 family protein [Vicinamibacterales bacterium]